MINVYPNTKQIPADPTNYRACFPKRATYALIVLHITDGHERALPVAQMFATPKAERKPPKASSAHFVIDQDGTIIQCVDLGDVAYHASEVNAISVGIEHCARTPKEFGPNDPGLPLTDAQYAASTALVAWLCRVSGLPPDRAHIKGHAEASPKDNHDDCPTGQLDWPKYMNRLQQELLVTGLTGQSNLP